VLHVRQVLVAGTGFMADAYDLFVINIGERDPFDRRHA
jgi:hypothetical protein